MLSRRAFIGPAVLLLAASIGYPAYWYYAASFAESLVVEWVAARRADGYLVEHDPLERSGFPFLVRLRVAAPSAADPRQGWSWRGQTLILELRPWDIRRIRLEVPGDQRLHLRPKLGGGDFTLQASDVAGVALIGERGGLRDLSLNLRDIRLTEADAGGLFKAGRLLADLSRPERPPIAHTEQSLSLSFRLENAEIARIEPRPLGATIAVAQANAEFLGPLAGDSIIDAAESWRRAGGTLEIRWLNLVWGTLDLRANGTAALDESMRPLGALTADIRGYEETLEALAEAGLLRRDILPASRVTLNLLARKDAADGRRVLTVPLTAQDGALFLGPIRLTDLPSLFRTPAVRPSAPQG